MSARDVFDIYNRISANIQRALFDQSLRKSYGLKELKMNDQWKNCSKGFFSSAGFNCSFDLPANRINLKLAPTNRMKYCQALNRFPNRY